MKECECADARQQQPVGQSPVGERRGHDLRNQVLRRPFRGMHTLRERDREYSFIVDFNAGHTSSNHFVLWVYGKRVKEIPTINRPGFLG